MLIIRADILVNERPYSVTREAFARFKELKKGNRAKPLSDSILLDKLGSMLGEARLDYTIAPESYDLDGNLVPLLHWIGKNGDYYRLSMVIAKYATLVDIEIFKPNEEQDNPFMHEIEVNGIIVGITDHALERFIQRWLEYEKDLPANPLKILTKILRQAEPDEMNPVLRVLRLINNGIERAEYLRYGPWRMVLITDKVGNTDKALVTFERRIRR